MCNVHTRAYKHTHRYDGGLHYAFKGSNRHNANLLFAVAAGLNHHEIGGGFHNSQISGSYKVIKKKYANNLNVGQSYGVWSLGEYFLDHYIKKRQEERWVFKKRNNLHFTF